MVNCGAIGCGNRMRKKKSDDNSYTDDFYRIPAIAMSAGPWTEPQSAKKSVNRQLASMMLPQIVEFSRRIFRVCYIDRISPIASACFYAMPESLKNNNSITALESLQSRLLDPATHHIIVELQ